MAPDDDLTRAVAARCVTELERVGELLPGATDGAEDAVHDLRVSWRRAAAALSVLQRRGRGVSVARSRIDEVSRLARALGPVRDAHVALRWLDARPRLAGETEVLRAALAHEAQATLPRPRIARRAEESVRALSRRLRAHLESPARDHLGERSRVVDHVASLIFGAIERAAPWPVARAASPRVIHGARVDLKRLRDVADLFAPALGDLPQPWKRDAASLQVALGRAHDLDALARWTTARAVDSGPRVHAAIGRERARALAEVVTLWSEVVGPAGRRALALRLAKLDACRPAPRRRTPQRS